MRRFLARKQSLLIAITIAVVVTLWVASGELATGAAPDATVAKREASDRLAPFSVRVAELRAEPVSRTIVISGRTRTFSHRDPARGNRWSGGRNPD